MNHFTTIYDFFDVGFAWLPFATGIVFLVIIGGLYYKRENIMTARSPGTRVTLCVLYLIADLTWMGVCVWKTTTEYTEVVSSIDKGTIKISEGRVTDFVPLFQMGSPWETFCIPDSCFHYSDLVPTAGYHDAVRNGGLLHDGAYVRVTYTGNIIARLELLKEQNPQ